ncbi:MAG: hypothetical protein ABIH82_00305 [Candidatus Woesearchaeota archaeon]
MSLKRAVLSVGLVALLQTVALAGQYDVNRVIAKIKTQGEQGSITVQGIETVKYELVLDGATINGQEYDYVRLSYVPAKDDKKDLTSISLALFKKVGFGKYEGLIIYDGSRFGKADGKPDKILQRKFSWDEMLKIWLTDGESLEQYHHSNPDQKSTDIYNFVLRENSPK